MRRFALFVFALIFLVCNTISLRAQDSLRMRYGVVGGLSINNHTADFRALPGVPNCCPLFRSGSGNGPLFGLTYGTPLSSNLLFGLRGTYATESATLTEQEPITVIVNGTMQLGAFEHTVDATIATLGLEPFLSYRLFGGFTIDVGVRAGYMITSNYAQKEEITEPQATATLLDSNGQDTHSRIRNQNSGKIPDAASILIQGVGGLSYELPLNARHTVLLVPRLAYALALTDIVKGLTWKPNAIRAELGISFSPYNEPPKEIVYDTLIERDTITKVDRAFTEETVSLTGRDKFLNVIDGSSVTNQTVWKEHYLRQIPDPHDITAHISVTGLDDENNEEPIATLRIEEFLSTNAHPLLGYVFFQKGDSALPDRYVSIDAAKARSYQLQSLFSLDALGVHHNVLNIIGYRLKQYPQAKLTITGCNSNEGVEEGNTALSQARANTIRDYLVNVWKIAPSRLATTSRNLPEKPSSIHSPDGQEENRRVEITSDIPEVLDVFIANDTIRTPNPPQLRFKLTTASSVGVSDWKVTIMQGNRQLKEYRGSGSGPSQLDWDLANDQRSMPRYSEPLRILIEAKNSKGDIVMDSATLPTQVLTVEQKKARKKGDVIIDRFNLVLFDFGKADITAAHKRIVALVNKRIKPSSSIEIDGYTDRSGSAASNARLAMSRARATADALGRKDAIVRGIGEARLLFPNDTPEGRFHCRTVQITVKTPVE